MSLRGDMAGLPRAAGLVSAGRIVVLAAGYLTLVVAGGYSILREDSLGLVYLVCGGAGLVFLPRRLLTTGVWLVIAGLAVWGQSWWVVMGSLLAAGLAAAPVSGARVPPEADAPPLPTSVLPDGSKARLVIRSLGPLMLVSKDRDHAGDLLRRPVASFIFLYLLARAVLTPGDRVSRMQLQQELNPMLDRDQQREKLRRRISDLQKLPPDLSSCFVINEELVGLDLAGCDYDVDRLRQLRASLKSSPKVMSDQTFSDLLAALEGIGFGEFLPDWEECEQRLTAGRGSADQVMREARRAVDELRADVVAGATDALAARDRLPQAITLLEAALKETPERQDLAHRLRNAYIVSNRLDQARAIARDHQLSEV